MVNKRTSKRAPAKNAKAAKKTTVVQTNLRTASLPPEFFADLTEVFKRHGWEGLPHQISFSSTGGCDRVCDDGSHRAAQIDQVPRWDYKDRLCLPWGRSDLRRLAILPA